MLKKIQSFFDHHLMPDTPQGDDDPEHLLRLAIGALLLEMTRMDGEIRPEQCEELEEAVRGHFGLNASEVSELLELAEAERAESTDYFQFTSLINGAYTPERKIELIELLWRIAYANKSLHKYEEYLVRKVADLLHVPHGDFIAAKHKAGR
jgi:uncharacterized tellurite resistance protein B-like protein